MKYMPGGIVIVCLLATMTGVAGAERSVDFRLIGAVSDSAPLNSIADADALLAGKTPAALTRAGYSPVVNFDNPLRPGDLAHFGGETPFITDPRDHPDDFALRATGAAVIPSAGEWTFGVNSDDGFALSVGSFAMSHDQVRAAADTLATFEFKSAGLYPIELTYYERQDQSVVELFAAAGSFASFDQGAGAFHLVGDLAHGGLALGYIAPARPPYGAPGTQVPEPDALALLALALLAFRRKRDAKLLR